MSPGVKLLVSVRNQREAADALSGGADWIDLKEPIRGALGAVGAATAGAVVSLVGERTPVSAACGELADFADSAQPNAGDVRRLLSVEGVSLVKLGLSGCAGTDWRLRWSAARREIQAAGKSLAAVIYADAWAAQSPPAEEVLDEAIHSGCPWVLWDTFKKTGAAIDRQVSVRELSSQLTHARDAGLRTVVAGRVRLSSLARLPLDLIDMIAVRSAVCRTSRASAVCPNRTRKLREALSRHSDCRAISR